MIHLEGRPREDVYEPLDPGIADLVMELRERGFRTFASCSWGRGHAFPEPTIRMHVDHGGTLSSTAYRLGNALQEMGYSDYIINQARMSYSKEKWVEVLFWNYEEETLPIWAALATILALWRIYLWLSRTENRVCREEELC